MFTEVTYLVLTDKQRLEMYEDMEKRTRAGARVVAMVPRELGYGFWSRLRVETVMVVYGSQGNQEQPR